jgi:hypothetical protein
MPWIGPNYFITQAALDDFEAGLKQHPEWHPAPKPEKKPKERKPLKQRKPLPRATKRIKPISDKKKAQGRTSSFKAPRKRIPAVNKENMKKLMARYDEYIRSPEWKAKREQKLAENAALSHDGRPRCEKCGVVDKAGNRLHVHHNSYARFGGDELMEDLNVLCRKDHEFEEATTGVKPRRFRS